MSVEAMAWALRADLTGPLSAEHRLVLVVLADHAASDGTGAYPAKPRIAHRLGTSERSVKRALAALRAQGLIALGDQRMVAHIPANRRPQVWTLRLGNRVNLAEPDTETPGLIDPEPDPAQPVDNPGGTVVAPQPRGDSGGHPGGTVLSPKPRTKPPMKTNPPNPPRATALSEPCEHGQPAGAEHHPRTHLPRCPLCRAALSERNRP